MRDGFRIVTRVGERSEDASSTLGSCTAREQRASDAPRTREPSVLSLIVRPVVLTERNRFISNSIDSPFYFLEVRILKMRKK